MPDVAIELAPWAFEILREASALHGLQPESAARQIMQAHLEGLDFSAMERVAGAARTACASMVASLDAPAGAVGALDKQFLDEIKQ